MRKKRKIILSASVLVFAAAFSGYLIFGSAGETPKDVAGVDVNAVANSIDSSLNFTIKPLENLTNQFTDQALSEFVSKNGDAVKSGNVKISKALPEPNDVQTIISNIIEEQSKKVSVSDADILVNGDDSKETQQYYLVFVDGLIKNNLSAIPDSNYILNSPTITSYFSDTATQFGKIADILSIVKVPPSWKDIHKQLISFFRGQENIFQSLAAADSDPLRFLIASNQILAQETDKSFNNIKSQINKRIQDEGLI